MLTNLAQSLVTPSELCFDLKCLIRELNLSDISNI